MLLDLSNRLQKALENYKTKLTDQQNKALLETLDYYKGGVLPASVLKREMNIEYSEVNKLMSYLSTVNILKARYKVYCKDDIITGKIKIYYNISDIPLITCDECEKECTLINNIIVEFEVCM